MVYDLVCVGAGIANLSLAYKVLKDNSYDNGHVYHRPSVLIIDAGPKITTRICPKTKLGYCVGCKPCRITTGFGGAGCFSDCKLTYSKDVGGTLIDYVGKQKFSELQDNAKNFFSDLGASAPIYFDEEYFKEFSEKCEEASLHLVKSEVQHLGTEGSYELMNELYSRLEKMGATIICDRSVVNINFNTKTILLDDYTGFVYDKLSIAVGRYGSEWLSSLCKMKGIPLEENTVDIGVRVEVPKSILDPVTDKLYEMKIVNQLTEHSSVRTFCVNPGGYVVEEGYDNVKCVNGHSFAGTKSENTNFALLHSIRFTEPFNDPIEYGQSICKLANKLGGGHILVQRLGDILANKRTNEKRLSVNTVRPTLKDAIGGDLQYVLPSKTMHAIISTLKKLDKIIPGMYADDVLIYAPEVKFYSSKIKLNNKLQVENLEDVYFLGDSSGVTHGIIQACMSGLYTAENIQGGSIEKEDESRFPYEIK